jgi:hypothetical protein
MPRKDFAAFTRLDASDVNTYLMDQSVQTFAGTAARGSAITTPVEGMYTHLNDTDSLQFWNGSAWQTPFGLDLIKTQTIGTAVTSVVVSDAFSSTYDAYKIIISGGVASTSQNIGLRLGATATGYYLAGAEVNYATVAVSGVSGNNVSLFNFAGSIATTGIHFNVELQNPFLTTRTTFSCFRPALSTAQGAITFTGFLNDATSYTAFTLIPGSGTITGGIIRVYGFRK